MIPDYETNHDLDPIQDDVPINERTPRGLALRSSSDNEEPVELQGTVYTLGQKALTHSRMGHYFFSYLLTWEVDLIEILEIMPQM